MRANADVVDLNVRRDALTGDVVISKPHLSWDDYFAWVATLDLPADFLAQDFLTERDQPADDFSDPFAPKMRAKPAKV